MPGVREFLNTATVVLKYAERDVQANPTGEFIITYNKEMNNNAASGRPEADTTSASDLPAARTSKYGRSTVPAQQLYTRTKWTGKVIAATQSKDSLVNALVEETKRASLKSKVSTNRQILGDGRDALGFYVSGAGASSGVISDEWGNRAGDFLEAGDTLVDLIDVTDGGVEQTLYIRRGAVQSGGRAVTFFDASTGASTNLDADAAAGDYFILSGTGIGAGANAVRYQMMGLRGIIDDGNTPIEGSNGLQGVPVASVPEFAAYVAGSDGSTYADWVDLKFSDMQAVLGEIDITAGGDEGGADGIKLIITSQRGYETYAELCRTERVQVNNMELDGGFSGISFNGRLPVVADKHCRLGAFFFWNPSSTKLFVLKDWDWEDADGSMFYRLEGGDKDALGATLKAYMEFGVIQRNANGVLTGVSMIR